MQAQDRSIPFDEHLKRILVHGYCHLLGYDHEKDDEFKQMLEEEDRLFDEVAAITRSDHCSKE
jgi:probable rRNA maturation factor